jgi:hypothetical protein
MARRWEGAVWVLLVAMKAVIAAAGMRRRRPITTLASSPLLRSSYKVTREIPPSKNLASSML